MKRVILIITFICVSVYAFAGQKLKWDPVEGASGYYLEIRDSDGNIVVQENVTENFYEITKLLPGSYSFRVATLNILKQRGESSGWIDFSIEKLYVPELTSASKSEIFTSADNSIIVRGSNFRPQSRFLLRGKGGEIGLPDTEIKSENEAVVKFRPSPSMSGTYDLVIINRGDVESVMKDSIKIVAPEEAGITCFAGAGYSATGILGEFSDYYSTSTAGADLYFQLSARNYGFENIVAEAALDFRRFTNTSSKKESTLTFVNLGFGLGYYYPLSSLPVEIFVKFRAGPVYTMLTLDENLTGKDKSSIDPCVMAGAGVRYYPFDKIFIEPAVSWSTVFYNGTSFNSAAISFSCGIKL